jgi:hypothetical protein
MAVAWFIGMLSLSFVPALLGIEYVGAALCTDGCQPFVTDAEPLSGARAWATSVGASTAMIVPPVIALWLLTISRRLVRQGDVLRASVLVVLAQAAAQWFVFAGGGIQAIAAFACLGAGVVIWATVIVPVPVQPALPIEPVSAPSPV